MDTQEEDRQGFGPPRAALSRAEGRKGFVILRVLNWDFGRKAITFNI